MKRYLTYLFGLLSLSVSAQTLKSFDIQTGDPNKPQGSSYPALLYNHNGTLFFKARDSAHGNQLHKTDGTYQPVEIRINPSYNDHNINFTLSPIMTTIGNDLYFVGDDSIHGQEIWRYDGVQPYLVADLDFSNNAMHANSSNYINWLYSTGENIIYARENRSGKVLAYNTQTKKERILTIPYKFGTPVAVVNNTIFSSSLLPNSVGFTNIELATYNLSTDLLTYYELTPGLTGTTLSKYIADNKKAYILGGAQLYVFDTENDPKPIQLTDTNEFNNGKFYITNLLCMHHGSIYFSAVRNNNHTHAYLYKYDPQNQTTSFVDSTHANIKQMVSYANKLFYVAVDSNYGEELFMINEQGNVSLVADIGTGKDSGYPWNLTVANNSLFFKAISPTIGNELFVYYDATAAVKNTSFYATVTVYPNPAQDVAHIKMDLQATQKLSITLMDMYGRTVYNTGIKDYNKGTNITEIPTHNLQAGMYIYHISNDAGSTMMSGKLQKQ